MLGHLTPQIESVVLTRSTMVSYFDLGVSSGNHTAGYHLIVVVPPLEHNSLT